MAPSEDSITSNSIFFVDSPNLLTALSFLTSPSIPWHGSEPLYSDHWNKTEPFYSFQPKKHLYCFNLEGFYLSLCSVPEQCFHWRCNAEEIQNSEFSASYSQLNWNFLGLLDSMLNWKCLIFCPLKVKQVLFHAQTPVCLAGNVSKSHTSHYVIFTISPLLLCKIYGHDVTPASSFFYKLDDKWEYF